MSNDTLRDAHAVMLPAIAGMDIEAQFESFLAGGGQAILIGEDRSEYVARRMSDQRLQTETASDFTGPLNRLRAAYGPFIVALDEELAGIQRLEGLAPRLPSAAEATQMSDEAIADSVYAVGKIALELGVTMFLAPIADVVTGSNPWLANRTLGSDVGSVSRITTAYIAGARRAGITPVAKHFPGYSHITADPALEQVSLEIDAAEVWANAEPFRALIAAGVPAVMTGPAPVSSVDAELSASLSPRVMERLRGDFGFKGLIVTDDIDAPATLGDRTLSEASILALKAGADLLLIGNGPHLAGVCRDIANAADTGELSRERLADAAGRVRRLAMASTPESVP